MIPISLVTRIGVVLLGSYGQFLQKNCFPLIVTFWLIVAASGRLLHVTFNVGGWYGPTDQYLSVERLQSIKLGPHRKLGHIANWSCSQLT